MSLLSAYRRGVILLDWTLTRMYIRKFEVAGRENVPLEGPLILASNHLNNADPPMIALAAPRHPTFMAKQEMINWPILGPGFRIFGAFAESGTALERPPEGAPWLRISGVAVFGGVDVRVKEGSSVPEPRRRKLPAPEDD